MSLFKGIKRAFGVSDEDDENEVVYHPSSKREPYINPFKKEPVPTTVGDKLNEQLATKSEAKQVVPVQAAQTPAVKAQGAMVSGEFPKGIFDGIIKLINHNLPEIVQKSINLDVERQAIYASMGPQLEEFVSKVRDSALQQSKLQWASERSNLTEKVNAAEARSAEAAKKEAELRERLSVENAQRKAVVTRAQDLEMKIAKYEAEYEQFQIENKSLVARMRAMQVSLDDATRDAEDVKMLRAEVGKLRVQNVELSDNLNRLHRELHEKTAELEELKRKGDVKEIEAEFKQKMAVANQLLSEQHNNSVRFEREAAEANEKLQAANKFIAEQNEELESLREDIKIAEELQEEIEKVEQFKKSKDEEISKLKAMIDEMKAQHQDELASKEAELVAKETEIANARRAKITQEAETAVSATRAFTTDEKVVNTFAFDEPAMPAFVPAAEPKKKEITPEPQKKQELDFGEKLMQEAVTQEKTKPARKKREPKPKPAPVKSTISVSAIDDLEEIDWLMPSPPSEAEPVVEDPVVEAKPKPVVETPKNQMSLFD